MKIAELTVRRPLATAMGVLIVLVLGAVSLGRLPIDLLPKMSYPMAVVVTSYEGAGPQEVEQLVTKSIESVMGTVSNVKKLSSSTSSGSSMVMVEFAWGTDMDFAALQMREKLDLVKAALPKDVGAPMVIQADPSMMPIMQLSLSGNDDLVSLKKTTDEIVKKHLERIDGVASVSVTGGRDRVIMIEANPFRLQAHNLAFSNLEQALSANNMNLPGGVIPIAGKELMVRTTGEFKSVDEIANTLIPTPTGGMVRLGDVASVEDGFMEEKQISTTSGRPSVGIAIQKQSTANTVQVSRKVRKELAKLESELPAGVKLATVMDQAEYIEESIGNVASSAGLGAILAILVLYFFLKSLRPTLVIAAAIPISIVATFVLMYFNKLSLNLMSLGGLALGVGMLVDNAIVVLENIFRFRELGRGPEEAAVEGASEVGAAITASTLTTIAVFLPIVFIQGLVSELFKQLALTVTFSLVASLIVALTLVPALASKLLRRGVQAKTDTTEDEKEQLLQIQSNAKEGKDLQSKLNSRYMPILKWCLGHRKLVAWVAIGAFVVSAFLLGTVGSSFMPATDEGAFSISVSLPHGTELTQTQEAVERIESTVSKRPEVDVVFASTGSGGAMIGFSSGGSETGQLDVRLLPKEKRKLSTREVISQVRQEVGTIAGAEIKYQESSMMGTGFGGAPIMVNLQGDDIETLGIYAHQLERQIAKLDGVEEVNNSLTDGNPEVQVRLKRDQATTYGLSVYQVASQVRTALQGQVATRYRVGGDEVDVMVRLPKELRDSESSLENLIIATPTGAQVPLVQVADLVTEQGPVSVTRENQQRIVTISAKLKGSDVGGAMAQVRKLTADLKLPRGYSLNFGGESQQMADSFRELIMALLLAVFLVYMVMVIQYESLLHPFVILFSMPLAFIGVAFSLFLTGHELSVPSLIGIIMLAGIIVNNAIVMVDYINQLRARGLSREDAILLAGPTRLRPVLMTTLTTILGLLPLALGIGSGAEMQAPLATVMIGGLLVGTILTLVVLPVVYTLLEDIASRWSAKLRGKTKTAAM